MRPTLIYCDGVLLCFNYNSYILIIVNFTVLNLYWLLKIT